MKKRSGWVVRALAGCVLAHGCMMLAAIPDPTVKTAQGEAAGKWIEGGTEMAFRCWLTTPNRIPAYAATAIIRSAVVRSTAIGFCTSTCFPASAQSPTTGSR